MSGGSINFFEKELITHQLESGDIDQQTLALKSLQDMTEFRV